jgi:hypothetical protein
MLSQNIKAGLERALDIQDIALLIWGVEQKIKSEAERLSATQKLDLKDLRDAGEELFISLGVWRK